MSALKAWEVVLDENRKVMGRDYGEEKDAILFRIVNGACVTSIALTHEALYAMLVIPVKIKKRRCEVSKKSEENEQ